MMYDYAACSHRVYMDAHGPKEQRDEPNEFVQMLWAGGNKYEATVLEGLGDVMNLRELPNAEKEAKTLAAMQDGVQLIYGGRINAGRLVGEPDLLRKSTGGYQPGDIKFGNGLEDAADDGSLKKSYALQLAHYVKVLEKAGYSDGLREGFVLDRTGSSVPYPLNAPRGPRTPQTWWDVYEDALAGVLARVDAQVISRGAISAACKLCHWKKACKTQLIAVDDLSQIAELGVSKRDALYATFPTVKALSTSNIENLIVKDKTPFKGVGPAALRTYYARARLLKTPNAKPYLKSEVTLPVMDKEVFFDIEADPMRDYVYLHGFVEREHGRAETAQFMPQLTVDVSPAEEERAFAASWAYLQQCTRNSVVYYYSAYEKTSYCRLAKKFPSVCGPDDVLALFALPNVIDLYRVVKRSTEWPTMDQSIKTLAVFLGFRWQDENPSGAASIEWFDRWMNTGDLGVRDRILAYNFDDCLATGIVLDGIRSLET